ncbi:MAG: LCP family protein [Bifidobacteriaceae bacterium]|jgi:LCP family protein required for cell wall assembly|nr:LCP family protein [Bifidobacteriaceae bacterium]
MPNPKRLPVRHAKEGTLPARAPTWLARALAVALLVAVMAAAWSLINLDVLPPRYLAVLAVVAVGATIAIGLGLWFVKVPPQSGRLTVLGGLAAAGITGCLFATQAGHEVTSFVDKANEVHQARTGYSVISLLSHDPELTSLEGQLVGQLATDSNKADVARTLGQLVPVEMTELNEPGDLASALTNGEIEGAVLDSNFLDMYKEALPEFYESIQVMATFEVVALVTAAAAEQTKPARAAGDDSPFVVYISGIDTFGSIDLTSRSDVNILVVINPAEHRILLVNTPRDYYVQLHGTTGVKDKLTHAGIYGIQMSIDTLEDLYDISIDYYVRINFSSLVKIVNTVGGIDVESEYSFTSKYGHYWFSQGVNHLNGDQALGFARERYAFGGGDRVRGENQQRVIKALITKAMEPQNLANYSDILASIEGAIQMTVPMEEISALVRDQLNAPASWQVDMVSADGTDSSQPTYSMGSVYSYVMIPDDASIEAVRAAIEDVLAQPEG